MKEIVPAHYSEIVTEPEELRPEVVQRAKKLAENAVAKNTHRAYEAGWLVFTRWCTSQGLCGLPASPQTVAAYISEMVAGEVAGPQRKGDGGVVQSKKKRRPATVSNHLSSIQFYHLAAGYFSPTNEPQVRLMLQAAYREHQGGRKNKKSPVLSEMLPAIMEALEQHGGKTLLRDRALLLLGFAGAFRRSELVVEIKISDVHDAPEGLVVHLARSKTDQTGLGRDLRIPFGNNPATCAVTAVTALIVQLAQAGIVEGPLFRSASRNSFGKPLDTNSVALIVKRCLQLAGIDPATYSGHSLRSGFVTSAVRNKAALEEIMVQTGHKDLATLGEYIRLEGSWKNHAGKGLM